MKGKTTFLAKALLTLIAALFSFSGASAETLTVYEGTQTSSTIPAYTYYFDDFTKSQVVFPATALVEIGTGKAITALTFYTNLDAEYTTASTVDVFLKEVGYTTISAFEANDNVVYSGTLTVAADGQLTIELDAPYVYGGGNLLLGIENTTDAGYKSISYYGTEAEGASVYGNSSISLDAVTEAKQQNFIPKTTFTYGEPPAVTRPTGLKVSYEGGTEAIVSWTSDEDLFDIDVNGTVTENVENPYTLTALEPATVYTVKVRAKKDDAVSDWSSAVSFTTDFGGSTCQIKLALTDSYGDGWNGNAIKIVDVLSGIEIGTFTNTAEAGKNEAQIYYVEVPDDRDIEFQWVSGSFPTETSYVAYDVNEEEIFSGEGGFADAVKYHVNCTVTPWRTPSDLAVSEITSNSAKLSWTENSNPAATAWVVAYKAASEEAFNELTANENPFVLEGLTPQTAYTVKVRPATDEAEKWSAEATFTTEAQFVAPTEVAASNVAATTATISWTGTADSYNLRYGEGTETDYATIILKTDDVWGDGSGYQLLLDADANTYGTIFPENGALTSSGDADASVYAEFEYKVPENADGSLSTSNIIVGSSATIEIPAGTYDWVITNPTPGDRIWIASNGGSVGGRKDDYVFEAGKTYEFHVYLNEDTGNDAVDVTITPTVGEPDEWVAVNGVTSPYTIEGLTSETSYQVEVQAVYADGESAWAGTSFTTTSTNPIAKDVAVEAGSTTANISWNGISDSYIVKYRTTAEDNATFFEDFENAGVTGLEDLGWTVHTEGESIGDGYPGWLVMDLGAGTGQEAVSYSYNTDGETWEEAYDADNWLITPEVELNGTLKFTVNTHPLYADSYEVLLSTTGTDVADFTTTLRELAVATNGEEVSIDLSNYAGQKGYIAIHHVGYDNFYLGIDNFGIYGEATPAGEWATVETNETSVELTGLDTETEYEFTIIGVKDGEENAGTALATFTTLGENFVPFNIAADLAADGATLTWKGEGDSYNVQYRAIEYDEPIFEADLTAGIPDGWTTIDADGDGYNWEEFGTYGIVSSASFINGIGALTPDNWLITPQIDLGGTLSAWLSGQDPDWAAEHFAIYLSTTGTETADFTTVLVPETVATGTSTAYTADLSAYAGQKGYIAIRHFNVTDMYRLNLDKFGIYEATDWQTIATTEATATISGLATNKLYEYEIQSVKGDSESEWSETGEFALLTIDSYADNTDLINQFDGKFAHVTVNRTLYKDNTWNTIYLPFDLDEDQYNASVLADGEVLTMSQDLEVNGNDITLKFYSQEETLGGFEGYPYFVGGLPYIVRWNGGSDLENPAFANVTITSSTHYISATSDNATVNFKGTYDAISFDADDTSVLFIGADNKIGYPKAGARIGATRGFFELDGINAGDFSNVKIHTNLDDDDATGIAGIETTKENGDWFDLSGRKLAGKPAQKGIYVTNGRKVTVK